MAIIDTSRIPGYKKLTLDQRVQKLRALAHLSQEELDRFLIPPSAEKAEEIAEGVIGVYGLPLLLVPNGVINGKEYLVPYVTEEPSNVSGPAKMFQLIREGGSLTAHYTKSIVTGHLQMLGLDDVKNAQRILYENKLTIIKEINELTAESSIIKKGGGAFDLLVKDYSSPEEAFLALHVKFDVQQGSGAMHITKAMEKIGSYIETLIGGEWSCAIPSNYTEERLVHSTLRVPVHTLKRTKPLPPGEPERTGEQMAHRIVLASRFAEYEPTRAVTHNKGIMNGIDAILTATGNDTRAEEADVHAYAARDGIYRPLNRWYREGNYLVSDLTMPANFGFYGSATHIHPQAKEALALLNVKSLAELAEVAVCMGHTQNFAALYTLCGPGISHAHDTLHLYGIVANVEEIPEEYRDAIVERMRNIRHAGTADARRAYETLKKTEL